MPQAHRPMEPSPGSRRPSKKRKPGAEGASHGAAGKPAGKPADRAFGSESGKIGRILQESTVPAIVADHQGVITHVNGPFETVFGWRKKDIVGKPISTIIPPALHDAHHLGFSRFLVTGLPTLLEKPLKLRARSRDGREFDAEHCIVAEQSGGKWIFGATIRPIPS